MLAAVLLVRCHLARAEGRGGASARRPFGGHRADAENQRGMLRRLLRAMETASPAPPFMTIRDMALAKPNT